MTASTSPALTSDEAAIRAILTNWGDAIAARNLDAMMAHYAPDVHLFDLKPPYKIVGVPAYRTMWEHCLPYFPKSFTTVTRDLSLTVGDTAAFAHSLNKFEVHGEPHPCAQSWIRVTSGLKKINGRWLITHEHVSLPYNPMTNLVVQITDPSVTTFDWGAACADAQKQAK